MKLQNETEKTFQNL